MKRLALFLALMFAAGCGTMRNDQSNEQQQGSRRQSETTTTETVRQVIAPDGQLVELRDKVRVSRTLSEDTATQTDRQAESRLEVEAPKLLPTLVSVAGKAASGNWLGAGAELLAGLGSAAVVGGGGYVALRRQKQRASELVKAVDSYASDVESAETDDEVLAVKAKHRERQKALGIHTDLERVRHG